MAKVFNDIPEPLKEQKKGVPCQLRAKIRLNIRARAITIGRKHAAQYFGYFHRNSLVFAHWHCAVCNSNKDPYKM
jgi:hypothetical protein